MKKSILKVLTIVLALTFMFPLSANAAKLGINKDEMRVGEQIEVTVTTDKPVESMQFDLKFDKTKYEFEKATSEFSSTGYNVIKNQEVVRVAAFDVNGKTTDTMTLCFNAIATGEAIPFKIDGMVELGEEGEDFGDNVTITVSKIGQAETNGGISDLGLDDKMTPNDDYYISDDGTVITKLPQTGDIKALGNFSKLGALSHVIPYALSDVESSIKREEVEAEFTSMTNINVGDFVKTGDKIEIDGTEHNLVLYGDVNKDGKVTILDALTIYKGRDNEGIITLDNVQKEAADVQNDGEVNKEDAFAVQEFILQSRKTTTGTIINRNPVKTIEEADIEIAIDNDANVKKYNYSKVKVATITAKNGAKLTQELLQETKLVGAPDGAETNNIVTIDINEDGTVATIYVYTTLAGNYMVRPVISGSDVENGVIRKNSVTVAVEENNAVTSIKILDGSTDITNTNVVLGPSQHKQPTIEFYHTDYDQNGNPVGEPRKVNVNASKAFMGIVPDGYLATTTLLRNNNDEPIQYDANKKPLSGAEEGTFVSSVFVQSEELIEDATATITIQVDNSEYGIKDYQKEIKVAIKQSERKTGIQLNGSKNPATQALTLYKDDPGLGNVKKEEVIVDEEFGDTETYYYTIIPIALGDGTKLNRNNITDAKIDDIFGNITIFENAKPDNNWDIEIKGYRGDVTNGYTAVRDDYQGPIDAIGIALSNKATSIDPKTALEGQGISIKYDGIEGNKVVRKTVTLTVAVNDAIDTTSDEEGISLMSDEEGTPVEDMDQLKGNDLYVDSEEPSELDGEVVENTETEGATGTKKEKEEDAQGTEGEGETPTVSDEVTPNKSDVVDADLKSTEEITTSN